MNFAEVSLSRPTFTAQVTKFSSKEHLIDLRNKYADSHVVVRSGNDIVAVPLISDGEFPGQRTVFELGERSNIVTKLMREAMIRFILSQNYKLLRYEPPRFMNRTRDLLNGAFDASEHEFVKQISLFPTFILSPRVLYRRIADPIFGIQIDCRLSVEIRATVAELIQLGLDVRGKYVVGTRGESGAENEKRDERSLRRLLGRIINVSGNEVFLDDTLQSGTVRADEVWLEPRFENLIECIQGLHLANEMRILQALESRRGEYSNAPQKLEKIEQVKKRLSSLSPIRLSSDLEMTVENLWKPSRGHDGGNYRFASPPDFMFDIARTKTHRYPRPGLEMHGPFDIETFPAKRANALVVVPAEYRGETEVFLRKFKEGIAGSAYAKGFLRAYHLASCDFHFEAFQTSSDEAAAYRAACLRSLEKRSDAAMAFVIVESRHKALTGDKNPYLVSKSAFMAQGIPVQEINIETVRSGSRDAGLAFTLGNIALASYAKMGGTPFVIASGRSLSHELIIGMGSSVIRDRRLSESERVVGITSVFTADGNYLLSNASKEVGYEEYAEQLLVTLKRLIQDIRVRNAWQPGDTVRLIFHVFKPIRDTEAQAVKSLIDELTPEFDVEYAFLHVSSDHDWFLFDRASSGKADYGSGEVKGRYVPKRGNLVPLGAREMLLTVTGPTELKLASQGAPRPLLLSLHRESTFKDLDYLAEQVYKFTCLSWRTFLPSSMPVTISYSDQIASLLGRLRSVKYWNPDVISTRLRLSRWFL